MKNILKTVLLIPVLFFLSSCGKDFLEQKPTGENLVLEGDAPKNKEQLFQMLNSCYDVIRSSQMYGGKAWYLSDIMTEEIDGTLFGGNWGAFYNHTTGGFNEDNRLMWAEPYYAIYRANFMMSKLDDIELTAAERAWFDGQCKLMRAIGHYEAVRKYGQPIGSSKENDVQSGVPIRLKASKELLVRSTTRQVYDQVLKDLDEAISQIQNYTPSDFFYLNTTAAKAFKAKILFYMNRTSEALPLLNEVITIQGNSLDSLDNRFVPRGTLTNSFPKEVVFGLYSSFSSDAEILTKYIDKDAGAGINAELTLSDETASLFDNEPNDKRKAAWIDIQDLGGQKVIANKKFNKVRAFQQSGGNMGYIIPVIHVTELKLMRAECAALGDDLALGRADLNDIRTRAGLPDFVSNDKQALIQDIRLQRRIEMVGEGNRLFEIKRIGTFFQSDLKFRQNELGLPVIPWNCPGMLAQIPDWEANGNVEIILNESGGCQ